MSVTSVSTASGESGGPVGVTPQRYQPAVTGWRHPVTTYRDQLTHAVLPGRHTAQCGVVITVVGGPWPEPEAGTPLSRCSICAQAVQFLWKGAGTRPDAL